MIFFSVARESDILVENSIYSCQYNFEKADWKNLIKDIFTEQNNEKFSWSLKELSAEALESEAEKLQKLVVKLVKKHIFRKKLSEKFNFKLWWSDKLKILRKEMTKYRRKWRKYHKARANYYFEIKKAKSNCWINFLENTSEKENFKAFQYTK